MHLSLRTTVDMTNAELSAIWLSLAMGFSAVAINLVPSIALAWILARKEFAGKYLLESIIFLPLVLPPVVSGYFLLVLLGGNGWLGHLLAESGIRVLFTWKAMAIAAALMGLPLFVRTARLAIESVDPGLEKAARTLGAGKFAAFFSITMPLAWPGIIAGAILCFARALGEFGATAMVSAGSDGNRTIALEIFRQYQTPGAESAMARLALISALLSAAALIAGEYLGRRMRRRDA